MTQARTTERDAVVHDVAAALHDLAELKISSATTEADAAAAMRELAAFNGCAVGLVRFSGETPWERHSEDELLYILEGEVELMVMMDAGPVQTHAREGCVVVVPRDAWHRQLARSRTTLLFVTGGTDVSTAEDPRG